MTQRPKLRIVIFAALVLVTTAAVAEPHCKADVKECEQKIREILANKRYLGVTLVETRWGTVIKEVVSDSPAARAGLQPNDRIVGINQHDCVGAGPQEVKQLLMPGGNPKQLGVWITVSRLGKPIRLRARLGLMPKEKIDKIVQRHIETAHSNDSNR
jgi:S1-C subfamily serine protease